jgi:hypothetical protein
MPTTPCAVLTPGQDRATGQLREGWNDLLAKITQHTVGNAVSPCACFLEIACPASAMCSITRPSRQDGSRPGFTRMPPHQTGVVHQRPGRIALPDQPDLLNGSGVALGDVDGDGLCDLYFCGLDGPNALYRNLGGWRFTNITASAGVACEGQASTGAVLVDIDGDGDLDLFVNGVGVRHATVSE